MHPQGTEPPPLKMPELDDYYQTAVPGQYLIGEVAGKPLVKNAANLGRGVVEHMLATGFSLHPSEPPRPSGLAITRSGILWATQILDGPAAADSLTLISLVTVGEDVQRVIGLQGWFQMLDSDGDGRLVLGTHEPVPRVLVVSVSTLMSQLDEHGIDVRKGAGHGSAARR
jgi:hypothetical protein